MTDDSAPVPAAEPVSQPPGDPAPVPLARGRRSRWVGLVWAVPLAALMIVAFLGIRAFMDRGIDVVVTFDTGAGAHIDDTKVIYQGVEAGHVRDIQVNPDGRRVDLTLRLDRRAAPALTTSAVFWLVGANPSLNDISSVKAALAGVTIGFAPGRGGQPTRRFVGLNQPPIVMPDTPGTAYVLSANSLATASVGSPIYFRGQQIGKVAGVRFTAPESFLLDIFILAPYDVLIKPAGLFWISSPVQVALAERGATATLEHAGALFNGAIEFDDFDAPSNQPPSPAGTRYPLYASRGEARSGPPGPEVPYALRFVGPAGELSSGAAIRLAGFRIGEVRSVRLDLDPSTGETSTRVEAVLYPKKLHIDPRGDPQALQRQTDQVVNRLLAAGHRARLVQTPPLIGGRAITFDTVRGAARTAMLGAGRQIPSDDTSAGFDEITGQVNELLGHLNRIPFDGIGRDVQQITTRLNGLVSSPQLAGSLQHLDATLAQADQMMHEVAPQVGPLVAKLNRAADEVTGTVAAARGMLAGPAGTDASSDVSLPETIQQLSDAARSIRALADYLGRHPESLLRGRGADSTPALPTEEKKR
ncbi:MAG: MlaD family protein [Pseudomonadota bacterium]|nr:MlaD family protein [Pseudomonadota bacterium]